ncbi:MAG: glycine cleavage system protein T [Polyangiaceae bacterium UTPRO1]|jgi:aminomethyltransferase|nr:glycine cleavage system aminomethyltransferase GcvT [Myxococcales bacterium]OQY66967.1 MAG: glycine cleavage system protein T [Polyangiaceae bacterium UTPRO1]
MNDTSAPPAGLARTPLSEQHRALGAKLVEFGGWEMPLSYRGIVDEHRAVRAAAGLFDVSHMGEIELIGPQAAAACQRLTTNDVRRLGNGHVQYTLLCREDGGIVDDVTLYRVDDQRYFFCVNAANIAKGLAWIEEHAGAAAVVDRSAATASLALQGPAAADILARLTSLPLSDLRSFRFARGEVAGMPAFVSRTGYTGEDGFELYVDAARVVDLWGALLGAGAPVGLEPVGLGARDTLRLEAGFPLYGHELDDQTSPLAAGLQRWVRLDGEDFIGRAALRREREQGSPRRLVGLEMRGPGIARRGYRVSFEGAAVGIVTSGTMSPTLGRAVALAYVSAALANPGTMLAVDVRGRSIPAEIVATPFYRRPRPAEPAAPEAQPEGEAAPAPGGGEPRVGAAADAPAAAAGDTAAAPGAPREGES